MGMGWPRQAWQTKRAEPADAAVAAAEKVLRRVPLVPPWTVAEFSAWIEQEYSRAVVLRPWSDDGREHGGRCGLLVVTADTFFVSYNGERSPRHQRQQIFHEIGHILCGHTDESGSFVGPLPGENPLTEGIDPAMIQHVLHRGAFDSDEERAAELVGTQLAVFSRQQRGTSRFDRIASAFFEPIKR